MLLAFASLVASDSDIVTPLQPATIYVQASRVLVARDSTLFTGKAYLSSSSYSHDVFGSTGYYVINFTSAGYVDVYSTVTQTFYYSIFSLSYCTSIDIFINPPSGHYYGTKAKKFSTTYSTNETMSNRLARCFWYVMDSTYSVTLRTSKIESTDKLSYSTSGITSFYYVPSSTSTEKISSVSVTDEFRVMWKTDSSTVKGYAGFWMTKTGSDYGYLRPTSKNMKCISSGYSCTWHTMNSNFDDDVLTVGAIVGIVFACIVVIVVIVIILSCCCCFECWAGCCCYCCLSAFCGSRYDSSKEEHKSSHHEETQVVVITNSAPQPQPQYVQPQPAYVAQPGYVQPQVQYGQPQYVQPQQPYMQPQQPYMQQQQFYPAAPVQAPVAATQNPYSGVA